MNIELLEHTSDTWNEFLEQHPHDFYYLPGYVKLEADYYKHDCNAVLITENDNYFFMPMLIRQLPGEIADVTTGADAITPYGYTGPLINESAGEDFVARALDLLVSTLRKKQFVSLFARFHPLFPPPRALSKREDVICHGTTVSIDLSLTPDEMMAQTRKDHRKKIRRILRNKEQCTIFDSDWEHFDTFYDIYIESMDRLEAKDIYYFPRDYFHRFKEGLGDRAHLVHTLVGDEIASSGIFTETAGIVQSHLSGTYDRFMPAYPSKLTMHSVRLWAAERGNRIFHMGGGLAGQEDTLFMFKSGFGKGRHNFYLWRLVLDQNAYTSLIQRASEMRGDDSIKTSSLFPAYRA